MNNVNTTTHSSKEMAEFSFENADVKSICYSKERMKKQTVTFFSVSKQSSVSRARLPPHTYTARVEWCGIGHYELRKAKFSFLLGKPCLSFTSSPHSLW